MMVMGYVVVVVDHFVFCFYDYISILIARQRYEKKSSIVQLKNVTSAHGMERKPAAFCLHRKASKNMENLCALDQMKNCCCRCCLCSLF